jgi:hypothetical protein
MEVGYRSSRSVCRVGRVSFQDVAPTVGPLGESCQCQLSVISRKASE